MADAPKLLGTDTLRTAYPKINSAIDNANEAINKHAATDAKADSAISTANGAVSTANAAVSTADEANAKSNETQTQLNTIILESGTSDAEVVQARGNKPVLNERLNSIDALITENRTVVGGLAGLTYHSDVIQLFINSFRYIRIPKGDYVFDKVVSIPSNRHIVIEEGTTITLKDASNQYIFRNADWVNGNENITLTGGFFDGKATTQTRVFGSTLENSYYGFGFCFYKVKNLKVTDMKIKSTNAWGIAHMSCDGVLFENIEFDQEVASATNINGDGITGQSSNVVIKNIRGYTNDDLVALLAYGAQIGSNELRFEAHDTTNWEVSNIYGYDKGGTATYKIVAMYTRYDKVLSNVTVRNVKGRGYVAPIFMQSVTGQFKNITIDEVKATPAQVSGVIKLMNATVDLLNLSNLSRSEDTIATSQVFINNSHIKILNVNGVQVLFTNGKSAAIVYDNGGDVENINFSNIVNISDTDVYCPLYEKNSTSTVHTEVRASAIKCSGISSTNPTVKVIAGKVSVSSSEVRLRTLQITPKDKDIHLSETKGLQIYDSVLGEHVPAVKSLVNFSYSVNNTTFAIPTTFANVPYNQLRHDEGSNFNTTNFSFTVPNTSFYSINAALGIAAQTADNVIYLALYVNGVKTRILDCVNINSGKLGMANGNLRIKLFKNDVVEIKASADVATTIVNNSNNLLISYLDIQSFV